MKSADTEADRCLTALYSLMTGLTDAVDIATAGPWILRAIGENLGWDLGVASFVDQLTGRVICTALWHAPGLVVDELEWTAAPSLNEEMSKEALASRRGLSLVANFPLVEREVIGLIEFFDRRAGRRTEASSDLVVTAGVLVGQFIARCRAQEALARAHAELEQRVGERTKELVEANQALARAMEERKMMEQKLRLNDRLAAIGTLAAGVAHEINNPMAYVISNLQFIAHELKALPGATPESESAELRAALVEAQAGAERVRRIVKDLKTFSRVDEAQSEQVDIHRVLEAALNVAATELRQRAEVIKQFGASPLVLGSEARLGQVFLNLLINSAQAIPTGQPGQNFIRIATGTDPAGRTMIEISDSGSGIPPGALERIFDPFFTTKPVGVAASAHFPGDSTSARVASIATAFSSRSV